MSYDASWENESWPCNRRAMDAQNERKSNTVAHMTSRDCYHRSFLCKFHEKVKTEEPKLVLPSLTLRYLSLTPFSPLSSLSPRATTVAN